MNWPFWLLVVGLIILIPTGYAAKVGAPFVPTRRRVLRKAIKELNIGKGDILVDLGAGDGTVLTEVSRLGAQAIGYELSPIMWLISWIRTARNKNSISYFKDFYRQSLPKETTHVFAFLVPQTMPRLKKYLANQTLPNAKYLLVSMFPFKNSPKPIKVITTPKSGIIYVYSLTELTKQG